MNYKEFSSLIEKNKIDYVEAYKSGKDYNSLSNEDRDINIFIPVRNRRVFTEVCIRYFKRAIQKSDHIIKFIFIEHDDKSYLSELCKKEGADYIFIKKEHPKFYTGGFAKALCYNIGWIISKKSKWNIFHDVDIIVQRDYFQKLNVYLKKNPTWIQPYTKRRVLRLTKDYTRIITGNPNHAHPLGTSNTFTESNPGSPGGSVVVRTSDFERIGGYDPELFWGYSPEDTFFWTKLEVLYSNNSKDKDTHLYKFNQPFFRYAVYANNPPIEVYHLEHPSVESANKLYKKMRSILESYWQYPNIQRLDIISLKKQILNNNMERLKREL